MIEMANSYGYLPFEAMAQETLIGTEGAWGL